MELSGQVDVKKSQAAGIWPGCGGQEVLWEGEYSVSWDRWALAWDSKETEASNLSLVNSGRGLQPAASHLPAACPPW